MATNNNWRENKTNEKQNKRKTKRKQAVFPVTHTHSLPNQPVLRGHSNPRHPKNDPSAPLPHSPSTRPRALRSTTAPSSIIRCAVHALLHRVEDLPALRRAALVSLTAWRLGPWSRRRGRRAGSIMSSIDHG